MVKRSVHEYDPFQADRHDNFIRNPVFSVHLSVRPDSFSPVAPASGSVKTDEWNVVGLIVLSFLNQNEK